MVVFWKADIFSITTMRKLNIAVTNWFVIINVHTFKIRVLFRSTNNFKLFLITDKLVTEKNRDAGREESVTDADRASEGDVECTGRPAEVPLRGSDESMYILYIWPTTCILYFLLAIFTAVFSFHLSPPLPLLSLYPFLMFGTEYSVYILYSILYLLSGWFFIQLYSSKCQHFFPTTQQFLTAVMLLQTFRIVYNFKVCHPRCVCN